MFVIGTGQTKLGVRDAVAATVCAADHEIVDLSRVGMEQHCSAISTAVIDGASASDQDWWSANDWTRAGSVNYFQTDSLMLRVLLRLSAHAAVPSQAGARMSLSHRRLS
jgi:hypothetical protein